MKEAHTSWEHTQMTLKGIRKRVSENALTKRTEKQDWKRTCGKTATNRYLWVGKRKKVSVFCLSQRKSLIAE